MSGGYGGVIGGGAPGGHCAGALAEGGVRVAPVEQERLAALLGDAAASRGAALIGGPVP